MHLVQLFFRVCVFSLASLFTSSIFAQAASPHEHDNHAPATIQGADIHLSYVDHAAAGMIGHLPVYFAPKNAGFGADLTIRFEGKNLTGEMVREGRAVIGTLMLPAGERRSQQLLEFKATRFDARAGEIGFTLNDVEGLVRITADAFVDNHFVNPVYTVTLGQKTYQFKLNGGHACIMCSTRLAWGVVTALVASSLVEHSHHE